MPARELIVVVNGSPYHTRQQALRLAQLRARVAETGVPFLYVNRVGGQDELVFDGASFAMTADGGVAQQFPAWRETLAVADFEAGAWKPVRGTLDETLETNVYEALVMGVRDYVDKNRFPGVLIGLSGGIDSALTLAVAVDALGRDRVRALMLPSRYNAADQPRGRAGDGADRRRALRRDPDRADRSRRSSTRCRAISPGCRSTPPRRTSRRASAARC